MYDQFCTFPELLDYLTSKRLAVIQLARENLLEMLLSQEIAVRRDVFHSRGEEQLEVIPIHIDTQQILQRLESKQNQFEQVSAIFKCAGLPKLEVVYETLVSDAAQFHNLLHFIGKAKVKGKLIAVLERQNMQSHRECIKNYKEVSAALCETPFERHLR